MEFCYLTEMTRCVLYLTRHKEVQEAAREEVTTLVAGHTNQYLSVVVEDLDQQKLTPVVQVDRVTGDERPGLGHKLPFCQVQLVICNILISVDISLF